MTWEPPGRGSGLGQRLVFEKQHGPASEKGNRVALYTYAVRLKQKVEKRSALFSKFMGKEHTEGLRNGSVLFFFFF